MKVTFWILQILRAANYPRFEPQLYSCGRPRHSIPLGVATCWRGNRTEGASPYCRTPLCRRVK